MRRYPYPPHLPPSTLILLAAHQAGRDMGRIGDLDGFVARVLSGSIEIDCSPDACRALHRAFIEADDRRAGRVRLWIDDLVQPDVSMCME